MVHGSPEEQENMAAVTREISEKLRRKQPGPRPPRPKRQPAENSVEEKGPLIQAGPITTRPIQPRNALNPSTPSTETQASSAVAPAQTPPQGTGGRWDSAEFKSARLKILDARKEFYYLVQGKGESSRLRGIEDDCREAIDQLKQVQKIAPESADIDRYITSAYKLISDCRAATKL